MNIHLSSREEVEHFINHEIVTTQEALTLLGVSMSRMTRLIKEGKVQPIKKLPRGSLFLRSDLEREKTNRESLRKKYRPYDY